MEIKCLYDELLPLHKIIPNPKNPNEHFPDKTKLLANNIDYQGIRWPIIISKRSGFIVAGHGRLYAAQLLGYENYPVVYQDFLSEAQEFEFLVADNKLAELSDTDDEAVKKGIAEIDDVKIEMLGYEEPQLLELPDEGGGGAGGDADAVPDVDENIYGVKEGDLWGLGIYYECPNCDYVQDDEGDCPKCA